MPSFPVSIVLTVRGNATCRRHKVIYGPVAIFQVRFRAFNFPRHDVISPSPDDNIHIYTCIRLRACINKIIIFRTISRLRLTTAQKYRLSRGQVSRRPGRVRVSPRRTVCFYSLSALPGRIPKAPRMPLAPPMSYRRDKSSVYRIITVNDNIRIQQ